MTKIEFLSRAQLKHGNKYQYPQLETTINAKLKIKILCIKHGLFSQRASAHTYGQGCPKCALLSPKRYRKNINHFICLANKIHGNRYDYSQTEYKSTNDRVNIICKQHGLFSQRASAHTYGQGCPKCAKDKIVAITKTLNQFIEDSNKIHGNKYDYSKTNYVNAFTKVEIICKIHGSFYQTPAGHLFCKGCPKCGRESQIMHVLSNTNDFINKAIEIHNNKYDYSQTNYAHSKEHVMIICKKHGEFKQKPNYHLCGNGCPKCAGTHLQLEVYNFIKQYVDCEYNNHKVIKPLEIDIYIPSLKLGIEVNGIYYHSYDYLETSEERLKHVYKYEQCLINGIKLLQITDWEWNNKQDIVKSIILNKIGKSDRIYARKCYLYTPAKDECKLFLDKNHIQGHKGYTYAIGLKLNNELVELMTFSKHPKHGWEIARLASKLNTNIVGGASRLFKKFLDDIKPIQIMTYADKRFGDGGVYLKLGFNKIGSTQPNYCYIKREDIYSRQSFQKHKLHKKLSNFDPALSESKNMFNNGFRRMWDAGHNKFLLDISI